MRKALVSGVLACLMATSLYAASHRWVKEAATDPNGNMRALLWNLEGTPFRILTVEGGDEGKEVFLIPANYVDPISSCHWVPLYKPVQECDSLECLPTYEVQANVCSEEFPFLRLCESYSGVQNFYEMRWNPTYRMSNAGTIGHGGSSIRNHR